MRPFAVSLARPSTMTLISVLVPPMSRVTKLRRPVASASATPATTPAAGPEVNVWLGKRAPMVMRISPPFRLHQKNLGGRDPVLLELTVELDQIALHDRTDIGIHDRGG